MQTLQTQGSLELGIKNGELRVKFADWFERKGEDSLTDARRWHRIGETRLNGSQAVTIKGWYVGWLQGAFNKDLDQ